MKDEHSYVDDLIKQARELLDGLKVSNAEWQAEMNRDDIRRRRPHTHVITVRGDACVKDHEGDVVTGDVLQILDGESSPEDFMEWANEDSLLFINSGYLRFEYADGKLWSITEFEAEREPTENELKEIEDYTTGQWSDGIGEGFEQDPIQGFYISAWHIDQKVTINVEKVEEKC